MKANAMHEGSQIATKLRLFQEAIFPCHRSMSAKVILLKFELDWKIVPPMQTLTMDILT